MINRVTIRLCLYYFSLKVEAQSGYTAPSKRSKSRKKLRWLMHSIPPVAHTLNLQSANYPNYFWKYLLGFYHVPKTCPAIIKWDWPFSSFYALAPSPRSLPSPLEKPADNNTWSLWTTAKDVCPMCRHRCFCKWSWFPAEKQTSGGPRTHPPNMPTTVWISKSPDLGSSRSFW